MKSTGLKRFVPSS